MYKKISDYGIIGNCRTAALVSDQASIDWACLPDFDSPALFLSILDDQKGGFFQIRPTGTYLSEQKYVYHTNLLENRFFNYSGTVVITDFMPLTKKQEESGDISDSGPQFIRQVKALHGSHRIKLTLKITPDFAQKKVKIYHLVDIGLIIESASQVFVLWSAINVSFNNQIVTAEFELKEGQAEYFSLGNYKIGEEIPPLSESECRDLHQATASFWRFWTGLCQYKGIFYEKIIRSALTLKLLTHIPTGAVVAAPTTSLPEKIGGELNWDYRFTWLRDASLTMTALLGLGYLKEAANFMSWLEKVALQEEEDIRIVYGIHGERELEERTLPHLAGYMGSRPIRIGNGAGNQKQFDVFGETLSCIYLYILAGGKLSAAMKDFVIRLVERCSLDWKEKDSGIWEERYQSEHHTYSKLMCWVGMDRGIKIAKRLKIEADFDYWNAVKQQIKVDILQNGYKRHIGAYVENYDSEAIDTSNLNIPIVGFLPVNDPTVISTLEKALNNLTQNWFVYRTSDQKNSLKQGEGAFFLSTFWTINNLALLGRVDEAKIWLDRIKYFSTPLGLFAEEFDPKTNQHLGNFPQAFSHLGFINSVLLLNQVTKAIKRSGDRLSLDKILEAATESLPIDTIQYQKKFTAERLISSLLPSSLNNILFYAKGRKTRRS